MKNKILLGLMAAILLALPAAAQVTVTVANAGATGTTVNTLTKLTGAPSTAVVAATSDTGGVVGITIAGAGTTGNAVVAISGLVSCAFDAATTAGDYVQISATTGGDCHDTGAATYPTSGQVIGRALSTNASSGTYTMALFSAGIVPGGSTTVNGQTCSLGASCTVTPNVTIDTATPVTVSSTNKATFHINQNATAGTAVTYNLPTAAAGIQKCFTNGNNGTAADTGVIAIATSASGQFILFTDGTYTATGGNVTSAGAAGDSACVVGIDSTHWELFVQRGTWTKH